MDNWDGQHVKVYKDSWLPHNSNFKFMSQRRILDEDCRVADLIDADLKMWKRDLIFQAFDLEEANQIISIPLSRGSLSEKIIWHYEKNGEFSVRSACHLCMQVKDSKNPGPSYPPCKKLWKYIWKAPVHPRVKNFLWRMAKNILHTKHNLMKKLFTWIVYALFAAKMKKLLGTYLWSVSLLEVSFSHLC